MVDSLAVVYALVTAVARISMCIDGITAVVQLSTGGQGTRRRRVWAVAIIVAATNLPGVLNGGRRGREIHRSRSPGGLRMLVVVAGRSAASAVGVSTGGCTAVLRAVLLVVGCHCEKGSWSRTEPFPPNYFDLIGREKVLFLDPRSLVQAQNVIHKVRQNLGSVGPAAELSIAIVGGVEKTINSFERHVPGEN
jgi:hypothetical protein